MDFNEQNELSVNMSNHNAQIVRRIPESRDIRFCKKRKNKYFVTSNDEDYKKVYKYALDKQVPLVKINYGPYEAHGMIRHRPQKLYGVVECLKNKGYAVELVKTSDFEQVVIEILGKEIYRVNIKYLLFNHDCVDDKVAYEIVQRTEEAIKRMHSEKNISRLYIIVDTTHLEDVSKSDLVISTSNLSSFFFHWL